MPAEPQTIDEYLAPLDTETRAALQQLRKTIKAAAPSVEECISYKMPGFRLDGKAILWFSAGAKHCSFHTGKLPLETFREALGAYDLTKGTIHFSPAKPLPATLVKKLVKTRVAETTAKRSSK